MNEPQCRSVRCVQGDAREPFAQFRGELSNGLRLVFPVGREPLLIHVHRRSEVQQDLTPEAMTIEVGQAERNDRDRVLAARGGAQCHSRGAGLEPSELTFGVAHALRENGHAVAARQNGVDAVESLPVIRVRDAFLAAHDGHGAGGVQQTGQQRDFPQLGVAEKMNGRAAGMTHQDHPVDQRVGVIAGENRGAARGNVLKAHHLDSLVESAGDQIQESNERTVEHGGRYRGGPGCGETNRMPRVPLSAFICVFHVICEAPNPR